MPELPDLTIYAKNLRKLVQGKDITSANVFNLSKVNATADAFAKALVGSQIISIERNGKELFFSLSNHKVFSVHLMLNGKFTYMSMDEVHGIFSKIICIGFADGQALVVTDFKGMCKVTLSPPRVTVPDAMDPAFTFEYFQRMTRLKSSMNIKALLIDQRIVRGIGNAYVDEILWKADISPKSTAGKIPVENLRVLYDAIHWVLEDAIEQIERISPDIISGEERGFLRVHNPKKKTTDDGEPILCEEVARKRTYYTQKQRVFL